MKESSQTMKTLLRKKRRFIIPTTIFFICYYFSLPLLVSYLPEWVNIPVIGQITIGWLLALSQFLMVWIIATLYLRKGKQYDQLVEKVIEEDKQT